jgi:hypothetical protein
VKCSKKHSPKIRGDVDKMEEQPCEIGEFRTEFEKLFHICGMSLSSASDMLCVRRSNVCAWNSGKKVPPEGVLNVMREYANVAERLFYKGKQGSSHKCGREV